MALPEWSDARAAAIYLKPCTPKHLNEEIGHNLERRSGNKPGTLTARGGGWLYHRHDLQRVRAIMDALGCKARQAVWLLWGIRQLGEREILPHLLVTLEQAIAADARDAAVAAGVSHARRFGK